MRLIYTTHDSDQARILAQFLSSEGIENQLEMTTSNDWGSSDYGVPTFKIWIYDEDATEAAGKWVESFEKDPHNPRFRTKEGNKAAILPTIISGGSSTPPFSQLDPKPSKDSLPFSPVPPKKEPETPLTFGFLMLCCVLYIISTLTAPHVDSLPSNLPSSPVLSSPINKQLLYDYPAAYELIDKIIKLYGIDSLQNPETLPPEGKFLLQEFHRTPYWTGFYNQIVAYFQTKEMPEQNAPMFEKIEEGEIWRLFTPCLLHSDFLHILFNMMWLIVLGKQLEHRLTARGYLLLILIVAIVSNTCQYLMSGPNFIGFSGVICGMVAFIWVRQKIAPWEGYPLEQATSLFLVFFISALAAIQLVSFYLEINHQVSIAPGIANTAHLTGAITGGMLAFLPFFKKRPGPARQKR